MVIANTPIPQACVERIVNVVVAGVEALEDGPNERHRLLWVGHENT